MRDTRLATRPPRCPKASELPAHFASFEEKLLKLTSRTGTCPLTPEGKRWAVLDLVPSSMEKELESQIHLFHTYEDLKAHALDLAARRSSQHCGSTRLICTVASTHRVRTCGWLDGDRLDQLQPQTNTGADYAGGVLIRRCAHARGAGSEGRKARST